MVAELDLIAVEIYLRCKYNPCMGIEGGQDAARVFVVDMERQLEKLSHLSRTVLIMSAEGYPNRRIAGALRVSSSTVNRRLKEIYFMPRTWEAQVCWLSADK